MQEGIEGGRNLDHEWFVCDGGVEVGGMFCPVVPSLLCGRTSPGTPTWPLGPCALQSPTPATTRHRFLNSSPADHLPTCLLVASSQQLIWTIAYLPVLVLARRPCCASPSSTVAPPTTSKLRTKYPLASRPHLNLHKVSRVRNTCETRKRSRILLWPAHSESRVPNLCRLEPQIKAFLPEKYLYPAISPFACFFCIRLGCAEASSAM